MGLRVEQVTKSFGETLALEDVSFEVAHGEIVAVLGPSGCGKSTLLAVIAGLEIPDSGIVYWNGEALQGVAPHLRGFGLMFQDYALFPHMNVFDNVAFGLRMAKMSGQAIKTRLEEVLDLVGLRGFERRDVSTLSGGEQQRVALARSLAPRPKIEILRRVHQTAIYVTHDQEEAFAVADRVVIMNEGEVIQRGTPQAVYAQPASSFVARFLGLENLLPGTARPKGGRTTIETDLGALSVSGQFEGDVTVLIRPNSARLDEKGKLKFEARLLEHSFRGTTCRAIFDVNGLRLTFEFLSDVDLPEQGHTIVLSFEPSTAIQVLQ
jgi:ABC-type Fe3+/spermidine/putrescine transport system ATPase subunit